MLPKGYGYECNKIFPLNKIVVKKKSREKKRIHVCVCMFCVCKRMCMHQIILSNYNNSLRKKNLLYNVFNKWSFLELTFYKILTKWKYTWTCRDYISNFTFYVTKLKIKFWSNSRHIITTSNRTLMTILEY